MQCYRISDAEEANERPVNEDRDARVSVTEEGLETVTAPPGWGREQSTRSKLSNEIRRCVFHSPAQ